MALALSLVLNKEESSFYLSKSSGPVCDHVPWQILWPLVTASFSTRRLWPTCDLWFCSISSTFEELSWWQPSQGAPSSLMLDFVGLIGKGGWRGSILGLKAAFKPSMQPSCLPGWREIKSSVNCLCYVKLTWHEHAIALITSSKHGERKSETAINTQWGSDSHRVLVRHLQK